jgi:hypothetical protein
MIINYNILNRYLRWLTINPESIQNPLAMRNNFGDDINNRIHETFAIHIFNNYRIDTYRNLNDQEKLEALQSSGIFFVENSYNFIQFKKDNLSKYFFNVDATIVFNNQRRNLFFENNNFRTYTFLQNNWIVCDENIFNNIRFNDNIQFDNLYKIIENETNKTSYFLFINNNYDGEIDIDNFVPEKINHSFNILTEMLGTHGVNKLSMGFTLMENKEHDNIALPIFVNTVKQFLSNNEYTNSIMFIDEDDSFLNYFNEIQNYRFI